MELRDIEYFEEIAEQRHLGRAAERLGLSQPALSKSLRRLEEAMQVKLFGRVDNLFNLHYQNPTGFLAPGLGVFGGIRVATYGVK